MELVMVVGAVIFYILTALFMKKEQVRKLWLSILILTIVVAFGAIIFLRFGADDFMANAKTMWQLYFLYFAVAVLLAVAIINFWMFRAVIWKVMRGQDVVLEKETKK
ncbi:hypothetical protein [Wohlfahrtiimonas larvae]|uniref:MFS transporter n=1 Tax=Wohlfahrtiimonas larvae TaxID=1157986 RepID=A0ABP9MMM3_9GAMM|nr:hypothetical protein [Wohlfahrtiimonas larvae]